MRKIYVFCFFAVLCSLLLQGCATSAKGSTDTWTFVSFPDFVNVDVDYPEPKWDDTLDYILGQAKAEDPDFVLVAGDLVMGRWWRSKKQLEYMADIYYPAWIKRMQAHDLNFYVVVGDHELGDNPWTPDGKKNNRSSGTWDCAPIVLVPCFEQAFVKHFKMPENGPENMKGLTYSFIHNNTLFIGVDVFEVETIGIGGQNACISVKQLEWLDALLTNNKDADHIIVFAHTPVLGPVRKENSSGLMYTGGAKSAFWKMMKKHNVDLYLCGEVHMITCIEKDGIEQIAHGGLLGYNTHINYLVGKVTPAEIRLELKELRNIKLEGAQLPQSAGNEPAEYINLSPEVKQQGFKTVGTMVIRKVGTKKEFAEKTGYFLEHDNPK